MNTATTRAPGTACRWTDCAAGVLGADGFCNDCGRTPPAEPVPVPSPRAAPVGDGRRWDAATAPPAPPAHTAATGPAPTPSATTPTGSRWSGPLSTASPGSRPVRGGHDSDIPPVPRVDPRSALLVDPQIPENERFCRHGGTPHPVGRSRDGRPARLRGHCPRDGARYDFAAPLAAGTLVAGQYQVEGVLAHGGLGWIYLAVDRNVDDRWVVLKGVLNADDPAAQAAARAERQFLAQLSHPRVVAIHNYVHHVNAEGVPADYIVMAYVGGKTLAQVWRKPPDDPADRVVYALNCMIQILTALGYLHDEGHVYCDLKPDNVMQCEQLLTLIDMGAVARIDDVGAVLYATEGYHAPEVGHGELSPASDLYTVGRTLAVLALGMESVCGRAENPLPDDDPILRRYESLHRLLLRATHPDPHCRFGSAEEMAEQLEGVRSEVLAVKDGRARPAVSTVFAARPGTFATGLLLGPDGPGRPTPATVADLLPPPLVETADPMAEVVAAAAAGHPVPPGSGPDWRLDWFRAVAALRGGDLPTARGGFDALATTFPGELAPTLALAAAAECAGDDDRAERSYARIATIDPGWADAAFGLARARLRTGSRQAAVAALHAVPTSSSGYVAAQLAAVEATLLGRGPGGVASAVDATELRTAAERMAQLPLDAATKLRMRVAVLTAAVELVREPATRTGPPVLDCEWEERPLRLELAESLRALAGHTPDRAEKVALIDRANETRPRTLR